eukprot:6410355-Prymnesium_polylepis.1
MGSDAGVIAVRALRARPHAPRGARRTSRAARMAAQSSYHTSTCHHPSPRPRLIVPWRRAWRQG